MSKLNELKEQVAKERKELSDIFEGADVADLDAEKKTEIADRTKGLSDLVEKVSEKKHATKKHLRN